MIYDKIKSVIHSRQDQWKLTDRFTIANAKPNAERLVMVLAGYKPELWPTVIPRLAAAIPAGSAVCLVSPGLYASEVARIAALYDWSYLSTRTNDVALAQNVCLNLHPRAELVCKLDEDMYLLPNSIERLFAYHQELTQEGIVVPGFVAPTIPVNGFCYRSLLQRLNLLEEFEATFGRARMATTGVAISDDPAAARWMWTHTAPLAATEAKLQSDPVDLLISPIKFSIGMIVFARSFWEDIRYFPVHRHRLLAGRSTLGGDEEFLCKQCIDLSRPIVVHPRVLAGHFSFGSQFGSMIKFMKEQPELFAA